MQEMNLNIPDIPEEKLTLVPVSYTHLDVYKRQVIRSSFILQQAKAKMEIFRDYISWI